MASIGENLTKESADIPPFIALDDIEKEKIERPFMEIRDRLLAENSQKEEMLTSVVTLEFSEWNHIFLYVLNSLSNKDEGWADAAEDIQQHKTRIETFLESQTIGRRHLETIRALPSVRREKILIVDASEPIVEFLASVFGEVAIVETALDGEEALKKTKEHDFDVIISDVHMLGISGIEFYKRAVETNPDIGERFLFLTGFPKPETLDFFVKNNLRYMTKPVTIQEIKQAVNEARGELTVGSKIGLPSPIAPHLFFSSARLTITF